jgi:ribonuclease D
VTLVADAHALAATVERLGASDRIALDVEGDGMYRYRARLCVLQLAVRDSAGAPDVVIIDALALGDLGPLATLLGSDGPVKIVHDAAFDARMLREAGVPLGRVLDTSVLARLLGEPASGLSALCEKYLGVALSKRMRDHDWGQRPLGPEARRYLADDVRYLHPLADVLVGRAAELGILEEVAEECAYVLARAAEPPRVVAPWIRVKGALERPTEERLRLRALANAREDLARRRDVPPGRLLSGESLLALARRPPRDAHDLGRVLRGSASRDDELRDALLAALAEAERSISGGDADGALGRSRDVPAAELPPPGPLPAERAAMRAREKALLAWRRARADERGVDLQVVLPGHCVADLVARDPQNLEQLAGIPGLGAVRIARDGASLLELLRRVRESAAGDRFGEVGDPFGASDPRGGMEGA